MKDKLRQLLALILALSICFSLLSANVWATDEPEDVPTESTEVVTEKDKSEEKQEETPAETPSEDKQEEAPAETQNENKQEEAPAETQSENKQEETPAETQSENKQEETPAETQSENKQEEAPAQNEAETQPIKKKAPARKMTANTRGGTEVTQANVICQQYSYSDAGSYSGGAIYDTPPADITNIALADAQAFGAAVNCPTTYWVVVYAKDGDNLKWTSNGKTGEQTSTPRSASGRVLSAWCQLYNDDVFHFGGNYDPMRDVTFYFSKGLATVSVTGVSLDKTTAQTIDVDGKVSFTATVAPDNATDKKVKWNVGGTDTGAVKLYSDEACTTEVGADAIETLTVYAKGISAGSATVTATSNADSEKKASCDVTVNAAQTQTETLLTTITATGKEQASYSTENVATVSFSYTANGYSSYTNNGKVNWGWWGYGWSATVNAAEGYTITKCVFYDDKDRTATDSEAPFVVETTEEDKTPKVNGTPILANTSKGITKIEVYGYATPAATHSVTITPGSNMTKTETSGAASQTDLSGTMTDVVYTADDGYYFPTDYSVAAVNGITVTRDSFTQITVSGNPTADAEITLPAPTQKTTPDAPTTAAATGCTTADNNDGKLTGVTTAMEYKKSDVESWLPGSENGEITGLVPGTYYVRIKATDTANASANQELTIKGFIAYTVTFKVVNGKWDDDSTVDKTVTLTGYEGDTLKLASNQIPAVGTKPSDTYKAGSWDVTPSTDTAITAATTYTYTYAQKDSISQTVTFKVVNGSWNDETTTDKTVTLTGYEGDTLKLAANQIPAVGTKPSDTYKAGSWDVTPSTDTAITAATTYTYTYAQKDSISQTVTFKVVNGSWNDETTTDKTVTLTGYEGDTLKLAANQIPAVGTKPNDTYKAGSWDTTPSTETAITEATTYTYTYAAKEASVVTKAPEAKTLTYNGSAQELVTAGEATGGEMQYALGDANGATQPYTTSIPTATNTGTYTVWYKVVGGSNHNDIAPAKVDVTIAQKEVGLNWGENSFTYDGQAHASTASATGVESGDTCTVTVTGEQTNAGENYTATATSLSNSNYKLPSANTKAFSIAKKNVTITGLGAESKIYDGSSAATVTGTAVIDGKVGNDNVSVSAGSAAFADKNVGEDKTVTFSGYSLSGTDAGNYNLTAQPASVTANITKKDVTITGLSASSKTYDGNADAAVTGTAVISGKVEGDDVSVTTGSASFSDKNAGENKTVTFTGYSLSGEDKDNYNLTAQPESVTANINQASITITADNKSTAYKDDLAELTFTNSALVEGDSVDSLKITATTTATKDSPKGEYPITLVKGEGSNPNYNVTLVDGSYTINEADATITASAYTDTYDGQEHGITVEVKDEPHNILDLITALFGADEKTEATVYYSTESVEQAQADKETENPMFKDAGTYTVYYAVEFGGNYKADPVTGAQTVTITKAPLTVTAKDKTISYGEAPANDGVQYDGFAEGEDEKVLTGELSYAYNYKQGDNSGEYTITPSGLTSDNYEITFVDGKLTVSALGEAAITVTTEGDDSRLDIELDQESAEKLLTEDELKDYNNGVSATVYVLVDELSASDVPAADKKLAEEFMKDGKIGQYLDLTLWVKVGNRDARQITNAASDITLKIAIPEKLQSKDAERTFYLIRVHDGKAESLASTTGDTLEADSRLFSTYAIGYKDTEVKDDTKKDDTKKDDTKKDTTTKTKTNTSKTDTTKKSSGRSPKTGDAAMLGVWFSLAGASATGLGALTLGGKKRNRRIKRNYTGRRLNK